MARPCLEDLRERAMAMTDSSVLIQRTELVLKISPSCVSKLLKRRREGGELAHGQARSSRQAFIAGRRGCLAGRADASGQTVRAAAARCRACGAQ